MDTSSHLEAFPQNLTPIKISSKNSKMTWCRIITWNQISCSSIGKLNQIPPPTRHHFIAPSQHFFTEKFRPQVPWSKEWCRLRVAHHDASLEYLPPSPGRRGRKSLNNQKPVKNAQKTKLFFRMFSETLNVKLFTTLYRLKLFAFRNNDTWFDRVPSFYSQFLYILEKEIIF